MPDRSHLHEELLAQVALGIAGDSDVALIEAHLETCAVCQERVRELQGVAHALRALDDVEPRHSAPRWQSAGWIRRLVATLGRRQWPRSRFGLAVGAVGAVATFVVLGVLLGEMTVHRPDAITTVVDVGRQDTDSRVAFALPPQPSRTPPPQPSRTPPPQPSRTPPPQPSRTPTPQPTAAPTPQPTAAPASPGPIEYTIQPDETLSGIAERFGVSVEDIVEFNDLLDAELVFVGQIIEIPTSPSQIVERREANPDPVTAVVLPADGLNVRDQPNTTDSTVQYVAPGGSQLNLTGVVQETDGSEWHEVEDGNWVHGRHLRFAPAS